MVARALVLVVSILLGGCFMVSWLPWSQRGAAGMASGPAVSVEACAGCHVTRPGHQYVGGVHTAMGIRCGQCHVAGNHPDFTQPVRDGTCGGCHQPQFQQTLASKHFATRVRPVLDGDRAARIALREGGFLAAAPDGGERFAGDATADQLGGRLCAACHFDEHRLGLRAVHRPDFCIGCHANRADHFPGDEPTNRCVSCHVRVGESVTGQVVNSHRFALQ